MKKPNRVVAPIIIAGITVGFLVSAYKFVIAKSNRSTVKTTTNHEVLASQHEQNNDQKEPI